MITWIENPSKYTYIRKNTYMSLSPRFPVKTIGKHIESFSKLMGYELVSKEAGKGMTIYHFDFYWLKMHDRDIDPDGVYAGENTYGGFMPFEAVNPAVLS